jgi:hypothetical protein
MNIIPNRKPRSLRRSLTLAVVNSVVAVLGLGAGMAFMPSSTQTIAERPAQSGPSYSAQYVERLMDRNDCREANGVLPNAAVVDYQQSNLPVFVDDFKGVDAAFNWALGDTTNDTIQGVTLLVCS